MKKKRTKRIKEVERANAEIESPKNLDFLEVCMTHEGLDKIAQKNMQLISQRTDPILRKHTIRRQEKLLRKVFKSASQVLTDIQFQIFIMRYIYSMKECEIASLINRNQSYVPSVLRACVKKIQKRLRIDVNLIGVSKDRKKDND